MFCFIRFIEEKKTRMFLVGLLLFIIDVIAWNIWPIYQQSFLVACMCAFVLNYKFSYAFLFFLIVEWILLLAGYMLLPLNKIFLLLSVFVVYMLIAKRYTIVHPLRDFLFISLGHLFFWGYPLCNSFSSLQYFSFWLFTIAAYFFCRVGVK